MISIEDVYKFEPMPDKLNAAERKHVLGLQGNVWMSTFVLKIALAT